MIQYENLKTKILGGNTMEKYINILIEENTGVNDTETLRNFAAGIELASVLDDGRLTRKEQEILKAVGRNTMILLYCDAIKQLVNK